MTHARFHDLAATALDFELESDDQTELDGHLAGCEACRAYADALRRDGDWLRALPAPGAPARVRRAVVGGRERRTITGRRLGAIAAVLAFVVLPLGAASIVLRGLSFGLGIGAAPGGGGPPTTAWVQVAGPGAGPIEGPTGAPASGAPASAAAATAAPTAPPASSGAGSTGSPALPGGGEAGDIQGLSAVAWSASQGFVAVGDACGPGDDPCAAAVVLSGDGLSWERVRDPGLALEPLPCCDQAGMRDVTMFGSGLVAVGAGADGAESQAALWWSDGGTEWSRQGYDATTSGWANAVVGRDDARLVAVGGDTIDGHARAAVWLSDDGRTWQRVPDSPALDAGRPGATGGDGPVAGMHDVADDGTRFVAVGARCDGAQGPCAGVAWVSSDGIAWTVAPEAFGFGIPAAVAVIDGRFMAVGHDADLPAVWTSADGTTWQPMTVDAAVAAAMRAVAPTGTGPIAGGRIDGPPVTGSIWELQKDIWSSVEGGEVFAGSSVEAIAVAPPGAFTGSGEVIVAVGRGQPGELGVIWRLVRDQDGGP